MTSQPDPDWLERKLAELRAAIAALPPERQKVVRALLAPAKEVWRFIST
jgi:hypothetical protein